jgi:pimeloyl-ACP methyl ester carboxylesterase
LADYVLVHGGAVSGKVWDQVAAILRERGHRVFAPDLSAPEDHGLKDHINEIIGLIGRNKLERVRLVGHSYAIPSSGKSLYDMIAECDVTIEHFGLKPDKAFVEPLYFDEEKIRRMPKTYIHCTLSEFVLVSVIFFEHVIENARRDHWDYYELPSNHACMVSHPKETAELLLKE